MFHVIGRIVLVLLAVLGGIALGIVFCLMLLRGLLDVVVSVIFQIFKEG